MTITVSDGCGHSASTTISVVVPDNLSITITAPTAACPGENYEFTATASNGNPDYTYIWSGDASGNTNSLILYNSLINSKGQINIKLMRSIISKSLLIYELEIKDVLNKMILIIYAERS